MKNFHFIFPLFFFVEAYGDKLVLFSFSIFFFVSWPGGVFECAETSFSPIFLEF